MPIVSTLGGSGSVSGGSAAPLTAGAPDIWPSRALTPRLAVSVTNQFGGAVIDLTPFVLGITITYGLDIGVSTATLELTQVPIVSDVSKYSVVRIYCSNGTIFTGSHNVDGIPLRFTGLYLRTEAALWPHTYTMVCSGMLYLASQLQVPPFVLPGTATVIPSSLLDNAPVGILLFTNIAAQNPVVNGLLSGPNSDAAAVRAILDLVRPLGLTFDPADIQGTSAIFGTILPLEFLWPPYRSALDIIHEFDRVCLGFRTYETFAGRIVRSQIFGYPIGASETLLTEGLDVWEGSSAVRSVEQLCNAAFVEGASIPGGGTGIINHYLQESNPFQAATLPVIDQFASPWIESSNLVPNAGLQASAVAGWRLSERNRELVTGQWVTFRDDLFFPGHSISINVPHTAVTEPVWIQRVEIRLTADPVSFTQTIYGLGGGNPGYGPTPSYTPPGIVY